MPRFVILEHDHPQLHWDFMLEVGEVLWTWRLATAPRGGPETIAAERIGCGTVRWSSPVPVWDSGKSRVD